MTKKLYTILTLLFVFAGCDNDIKHCGGSDPENSISWIKEKIAELDLVSSCNSISRSFYKGETVYIISNCEPNVNSVPELRRCDGSIVQLSSAELQNLAFEAPIELIWKKN